MGTNYVLTSADVGETVRASLTASNAAGEASVVALPTAVVAPAAEAAASPAIEAIQLSDPSLLAASTVVEEEGQLVKPAVSDAGEELSSSAALTKSSTGKQTPGAFGVDTPNGELTLEPTEVSPAASGVPTIVNGTAAVTAETSAATDTVMRPDALGATTLLQLASSRAPTSFSWTVNVSPDEKLERLSDGAIAVVEPPPTADLEGPLGEGLETELAGETTAPHAEGPSDEEETGGPSLIEALPASPHTTTPFVEPGAHELHPQDTEASYEAGATALSNAETEAEGTTLMVIEAPTVVDASGESVSAALSVDGDTVTLTLSPGSGGSYPMTAAVNVASRGSSGASPDVGGGDKVDYGLDDQQISGFLASEEPGPKGEPILVEHLDSRLTRGGSRTAPLHLGTARLVLYWNTPYTSARLKTWLIAVGKAKLEPFITLSQCLQGDLEPPGCPTKGEPTTSEPTRDVQRYREAFKKLFVGLRKLHREDAAVPAVTTWGAWNEPDRGGSPLSVQPAGAEIAAYLWQTARAVMSEAGCTGCRVLAGEFADSLHHSPYEETYAATILNKRRYWHHGMPQYWGMHDYYDVVNAYRHEGDPNAKRYLDDLPWVRLGKPHQWMTEAGVD